MSRFLFHASAIGIAGQITRPVLQPVPSVASALPAGGGYTSNKQPADQLLEVYSHQGATTEVTGNDSENGDHQITATATVQALNIGNLVLADSCTGYLSEIYPGSGNAPPCFNPQGSFFKNLRIAGRTIQLESRVALYSEICKLDELKKRYKENLDFRKQFLKDASAGNEGALHEKQKKYFPFCKWNGNELPVSKALGACTVPLFVVTNPSEKGFQVSGNAITVTNFGTVVLGELIISAYEWRLTMLHVDLGSASAGAMSACIVNSNGGTTDP